MEEAAVGSISHILKTAFKDVYEDYRKRDAIQAQIEEYKEIRNDTKLPDAYVDNTHDRKKANLKASTPSPAISTQPSPRADETINNIDSEQTSLDLSDSHKQVLNEKKSKIMKDLQDKREKAVQLIEYLKEQKQRAKELETLEEEDLKRQGILIGQHIPSLTSKLQLDSNVLNSFGSIASKIVVARDLVVQNKDNMLRRTGNLPISDEAEQRKMERRSFRDSMVIEGPHYLTKTKVITDRIDSTKVRFSSTLVKQEKQKLQTLEASTVTAAITKPRRKRADYISAEELDREQAILDDMQHKLNYLRNPRTDPSQSGKLLNKPIDKSLTHQKPPNLRSKSADKVTYSQKSTSAVETASPVETATPFFLSEPPTVQFTSYDIGDILTQNITFRNVSAVSRHVRIIPPATKYFNISPLKYPAKCVGGCVAPGITVTAVITFRPNNLGDFEDFLNVETEGGSYRVPLIGCREAPKLSIPSALDLGICLVGDAMRVIFTCTNTGGSGSFRLLSADDFSNQIPSDEEWSTMGCVRIPPFTVYPVEFFLRRNESVDLNVDFVPLTLGTHSREFVALCDNLQTRTFTLCAVSRQVDVKVTEMNMKPVDIENPILVRDLVFSPSYVGSETEQQFVVSNDTGLPLEYEWVWVEPRSKDLRKAGQAQLLERERELIEYNRQSELRLNYANTSETEMDQSAVVRRNSGLGFDPFLDSSSAGDNILKNRSVKKAFELSPARGVLSSDGMETFKVFFRPDFLEACSLNALLMLKSVPVTAVLDKSVSSSSSFSPSSVHVTVSGDVDDPSPHRSGRRGSVTIGRRGSVTMGGIRGQAQTTDPLTRLAMKGHGTFVRLSSWLDTIGESIPPEKTKPGDPIRLVKVVSLQVLLNMATDHVSPNALGAPLLGLGSTLKVLLDCVESILKSTNALASGTKSAEDFSMGAHASTPGRLTRNKSERKVKDPALQAFVYWDKFAGEDPSWMTPFKVPPEAYDAVSLTTGLGDQTPEREKLLKCLYVEIKNALTILGNAICSILDVKVKHECVDYIQTLARTSMPCLNFDVNGESKQPVILVNPPAIAIGGPLSIGKTWTGKVTLKNCSNILTEVECNPSTLTIKSLDSGDSFVVPGQCEVTIDPPHVLIMPDSEETVDISMSLSTLGRFRINLPLACANPCVALEDIILTVQVVGPKIRFSSSEVDFGLIGVGLEEKKFFNFTNESNVSLRYLFHTALETDYDAKVNQLNFGSLSQLNRSNLPKSARPASGRPRTSGSDSGSEADIRSESDRTSEQGGSEGSKGSSSKNSSFKIVGSSNATVSLEPSSGTLPPGQTVTVQASCLAGKLTQRLRGMFECRLFANDGVTSLPSHYLTLRGEVQVPKVILYPMEINLGQVYVGRPVTFEITLRNLSNLPSKFKFERPGGDSVYYKLDFETKLGKLGPKETQTMKVVYTALSTGITDDTMACKIFGASLPLGFILKSISRGVLLEFVTLREGQSPPPALGLPTDTKYCGEGNIPDPEPIVPVNLGSDIPLYGRRMCRLAIRNLSAVPTDYTVSMKKYRVPDSLDTVIPSESGEKFSEAGTLVIHEDGDNRFNSKAGKEQMRRDLTRKEDQKYLALHQGAAYSVDPPLGTLPPWGVHVITVRAFNDMGGCFDDEIVFDVKSSRKIIVPLRMTVAGCPLVIEKDTVGMTVLKTSDIPNTLPGMQLLQMGCTVVNGDELVRQFRVRNNGSSAAKLNWKARDVDARVNGPIKLSIRVLDGKVCTKLDFWDDVAKGSAFKIEPSFTVIPPFSRQTFTVTMRQNDHHALERSLLLARAVFVNEDSPAQNDNVDHHIQTPWSPKSVTSKTSQGSRIIAPSSPKSVLSRNAASSPKSNASNGSMNMTKSLRGLLLRAPSAKKVNTNVVSSPRSLTSDSSEHNRQSLRASLRRAPTAMNSGYKMSLLLEGKTVHPSLQIDKAVVVADEAVKELGNSSVLLLRAHAPLLFKDRKSDVCQHRLVLTNPSTEADIQITVEVDGPFILKDADDKARVSSELMTRKTSTFQDDGSSAMSFSDSANSAKSAVKMKTLRLVAGHAAPIYVVYRPPRDLREAALEGTGVVTTMTTPKGPNEDSGRAVITFSTGPRIIVPISVTLTTPAILASAPKLLFGVCHVSRRCEGFILLSSLTDVAAKWTVSHVPDLGLGKKASTIRVSGFAVREKPDDDPTVFSTSPDSGSIDGLTGPVMTAMPKGVSAANAAEMESKGGKSVKFSLSQNENPKASFNAPTAVYFIFSPKKNVRYCSRYRFSCEYGNSFDVLVEGEGTYEEHLHKPLQPPPMPR